MKKLAITLSALAALTGSAFAADMAPAPRYTKAPMVAPPVATWTGCYINGGGGYAMTNDDHYGIFTDDPTRTPLTDTSTTGGKGWLGRVGAGCDYQFGGFGGYNIVVGAFGDYDFGGTKGTFEGSFPFPFVPPFGATVVGSEKQKYSWAVGPRVGILVNPSLLSYVNGGYTETHFGQTDLNISGGFGPLGSSLAAVTLHGWFLGGGTEFTVASFPGLYWRNEYRYSRFNAADRTGIDTATGIPVFLSERSKIDTQSITTSLVYKFNMWH